MLCFVKSLLQGMIWRQKGHMLNMQMGRESMSNKKPMILVLAGPNGSGKSTITQFFEKVDTYTNADDIVASTGMILIKNSCTLS